MIRLMSLLALLVMAVGCGSSSKDKEPEPREFERPYKVVDAKTGVIPLWINEPQEWASKNDKTDAKDHRYFVYDTELKNSRQIACQIAKARATGSIASEITQFIKQSLGQSAQGDPTDTDERLEEYVESTLAQEVQSFVVGAKVHRTYWEMRKYTVELGAERNKQGYVCSALVKISKDSLARAIRRAQKKIEGVANVETKENVKQALKDVEDKFSSQ